MHIWGRTLELVGQIRGTGFLPVTQALTDEVRQVEYKLKVVQNTLYGFNESTHSRCSTRVFFMNFRYMSDDAARYDG